MPDLDTARLALRPLAGSDAEALHALWTAEPVRRFLWDGEVVPWDRTREIVKRSGRLFAEKGFGLWGVRERGDAALAGFAGCWLFRDPPELELLFGVAAERWGRGLATEAAGRVVRYGFEDLGLPRIQASTDAPNAASQRVLTKLGMRLQRRAVVEGLDTIFYTLERDARRP